MRPFWAHGSRHQHQHDSIILGLYLVVILSTSLCAGYTPGVDVAPPQNHLIDRYLPDFLGADRSIIGRASDDTETLSNNAPRQSNIDPDEIQFWTFPKSELGAGSPVPQGLPSAFEECPDQASTQETRKSELRKRQVESRVFITLNTCDQPGPRSKAANAPPSPLRLYVSKSGTRKPDANANDDEIELTEGYGSVDLTDVTGDVYIGVSAPSDASNDFSGVYNYEITVSIDDCYAKYINETVSTFLDSDKSAALVQTYNTTTCNGTEDTNPKNKEIHDFWRQVSPPPYSIFLADPKNPGIRNLTKSMCALKKHAQAQGTTNIDSSIVPFGSGTFKQQFHVKELNDSTQYLAVIALDGMKGKINGGGTIWNSISLQTKSEGNCALLYDLDFCSKVSYAVPYNSSTMQDFATLQKTYDQNANDIFRNFSKSLAQIACNTTASAQYSLAVGCQDCERAYKDWLCAVTIPRCDDFSKDAEEAKYLQPRADPSGERNVSKYSRNVLIDNVVKPGAYNELLPCQDLCYGLVRSCPATLGFSCPLEGHGLNLTYGKLEQIGESGQPTCNFPGRDPRSLGASLSSSASLAIALSCSVILWTLAG